ncbi:RlpA-like double-psi beta-barrel-protein domain-containing protein-containing protein [Russula brevipes]|nr:RlpA-like double-psi beta-barrel-protein domain-containing protein-containing protein [Russula brevipes]
MKAALALVLVFFSSLAVARHPNPNRRTTGGWVQNPRATRPSPSCGIRMNSGYTAAVNELAFGASSAAGDACGRCFKITPTKDPYTPSYTGPFGNTIIVKVTDLCPASPSSDSGPRWCDQTVSRPLNGFNMPMHFDLCQDSGAASAFFPSGRGAMVGTYEEVACSQWTGSAGQTLWNGACLAAENAPFWPSTACGNHGTKTALTRTVILF